MLGYGEPHIENHRVRNTQDNISTCLAQSTPSISCLCWCFCRYGYHLCRHPAVSKGAGGEARLWDPSASSLNTNKKDNQVHGGLGWPEGCSASSNHLGFCLCELNFLEQEF